MGEASREEMSVEGFVKKQVEKWHKLYAAEGKQKRKSSVAGKGPKPFSEQSIFPFRSFIMPGWQRGYRCPCRSAFLLSF